MVYDVIQLSQLEIEWDADKNKKLRADRGISFLEVEKRISSDEIVDVIKHPNEDKYPGQEMILIEVNNYICVIPFIVNEGKMFLKTLFLSRKYTKKYLRR